MAKARNEVLDVAPDKDHLPGEAGERGTSALPDGHPGKAGLVSEKHEVTGIEKYNSDVVIDGVVARSPNTLVPEEQALKGSAI